MEPVYPLFVLAKDDNSIRLVKDREGLSWYEAIDVEDGLYKSWDFAGRPVELYLNRKVIEVRLISDEPQPEKLKEAILRYARLGWPEARFVYSGPGGDVVSLFEAVEEHLRKKPPKGLARTIREKWGRFFGATKNR